MLCLAPCDDIGGAERGEEKWSHSHDTIIRRRRAPARKLPFCQYTWIFYMCVCVCVCVSVSGFFVEGERRR